MATVKPELKAILGRYGINPNDKSQVWDCHGTLVLYHKAFEIIATKEGISFDPPTIIRGNKDEAVILVVGQMGERIEWSFGEAAIGQNYQVAGKQAAYPYAMAEKRAKDRVVAKLAGLAQYVYSEDEADDFKNGERKAVEQDGAGTANPPANTPKPPVAPQTATGKPIPNEKSARAVTEAHAGRFELLFPKGDLLAKFSTPQEWCEGLRDALKQPNAEILGLWETNRPLALSIEERFPEIKWDGGKGRQFHAVTLIEAFVKKMTAGIAA